MMHMTFYWGREATLLFDDWHTRTWFQYYASLAAIILWGILHEYLSSLRIGISSSLSRAKSSHRGTPENHVPLLESVSTTERSELKEALVAILFAVNAASGYLLMLLVMSFNSGVFLSVVLGLLIGFICFGLRGGSEVQKASNPGCG